MSEHNASILVVDDEPDLRLLYELTLAREGYRVESAETVAQARDKLQSRFDVVLTDMRLPDGLGMELLLELQAAGRAERCIVVTAYGSAENAVEALRAGAFDYLAKPVELKQLRAVVASAVQGLAHHHGSALPSAPFPVAAAAAAHAGQASVPVAATTTAASARHRSPATATAPKDKGAAALAQLVGSSAVMLAAKERIGKVARSMAPVHIHGESGTGKELVARALHANSQRADGPLVAVNCGAIPENLLEAEFFGAKKGAYTGATQDRDGFFQAARGGTLFLDEIGDLPLTMQTKLLRAIQERSVRPLGGTQEELVDVRLISATHRNLADEVAQGRFRQDLYYRLNVIELHIPPLRERCEDVPALVEALLGRLARDSGFECIQVEPAFMEAVLCRPFPGNVRELENLLHRAVALSEDGVLRADTVVEVAQPGARTEAGGGLQASAPAMVQQQWPVQEAVDTARAPLPAPSVAPVPSPSFGMRTSMPYGTTFTVPLTPAAPVAPTPSLPAQAPSTAGVPPVAAAMTVHANGQAPAPPSGDATPAAAAALAGPVGQASGPEQEPLPSDLQAWLDGQERAVLIRALKSVNYNRTAAAALLGLNLRQMRYRIERLGIPTEPDSRA